MLLQILLCHTTLLNLFYLAALFAISIWLYGAETRYSWGMEKSSQIHRPANNLSFRDLYTDCDAITNLYCNTRWKTDKISAGNFLNEDCPKDCGHLFGMGYEVQLFYRVIKLWS
jgi:hypothetical protein